MCFLHMMGRAEACACLCMCVHVRRPETSIKPLSSSVSLHLICEAGSLTELGIQIHLGWLPSEI